MSVHPSILLEHLRLPHAAAIVQSWLDRAAQEGLSYADFLDGRPPVDWVEVDNHADLARARVIACRY